MNYNFSDPQYISREKTEALIAKAMLVKDYMYRIGREFVVKMDGNRRFDPTWRMTTKQSAWMQKLVSDKDIPQAETSPVVDGRG